MSLSRSNIVGVGGKFRAEILDQYGNIKHEEEFKNGWTNEGLEWLMNRSFKSSKPSELSFYIGIIDSSATLANGDTMSSHGGWTENSSYSETNRPAWSQDDPAEAGGIVSASNSTKRQFTMNADSQSIHGAFLSSSNTKGGSVGTLLCTGLFSSAVSLDDDDILKIEYEVKAQAN